jgi:hypothetical protein
LAPNRSDQSTRPVTCIVMNSVTIAPMVIDSPL